MLHTYLDVAGAALHTLLVHVRFPTPPPLPASVSGWRGCGCALHHRCITTAHREEDREKSDVRCIAAPSPQHRVLVA
jgi:hypothetical protein